MDSNHRMTESKSVALAPWLYPLKKIGEPVEIRTLDTRLRRPLLYPAELQAQATTHMECFMERMTGIEPVSSAWKAEVLPLNHIRIKQNLHKMERKTRFELATLALARRCSTPEPLPHKKWWREMDSNHRKLS